MCACNLKILKTSKIKYLGIFFDPYLKWNHHIEYVVNKIRKMFYKFYLLRAWLPRRSLLGIYRALVESVLSYGIVVWGRTTQTVSQPLLIAQKKILKILMFKDMLFPTVSLFEEARVLNITQLYIKNVVRFLLCGKFSLQFNQNLMNTRTQTTKKAVIPVFSFTATQRSLLFLAPKIFNLLPSKLRDKPYKRVKNAITEWLLEGNVNINIDWF